MRGGVRLVQTAEGGFEGPYTPVNPSTCFLAVAEIQEVLFFFLDLKAFKMKLHSLHNLGN